MPRLLSSIGDENRPRVIDAMFREGAAISWISTLYRHDIFYQGKFGDEKKPPSEWLFSAEELEQISEIMNQRFGSMSLGEFLSAIEARRMLFTWVQGGGGSATRDLINGHLSDDESFLRILDALESVVTTSNGRFDVLKKSNLGDFLDYDEARERVAALAATEGDLQALAQDVLRAFEEGDNY